MVIYLTFLANYFAYPLRVSGVSIPLSLIMNLVGRELNIKATLTVSPSVTLITLAKNIL
jgi:hypothetical protein